MTTEQNLYSDFHLKMIRKEQLGVRKTFIRKGHKYYLTESSVRKKMYHDNYILVDRADISFGSHI